VEIERPILSAICLIAILLFAGCSGKVATPAPADGAQRIVSLAPSVTEILFAIGAGPQVVGVSEYCDYPPAVLSLPKAGTFLTPNLEAIAALRPTMVIGPVSSSDQREMQALRAMGIATVAVDSDDSIAEIERNIALIGNRVGRADAARSLLARIRGQMQAIELRLGRAPTRSVLMVVGHQPMVAVGRGTFLDELLAMAHGENIADVSAQAWPRLSLEYIIATRPQVILDGRMGTDPGTPDAFWAQFPTIPAVQKHRVFGYPENPTLHPGPRIVDSLEILARRIHPEAFAADTHNPQSALHLTEAGN
jgi:iron complex transport system substrate-binding protein